ncbi:MAG: taurine dioxygenase [Alphaproteobacteria bacterium]|nr:taurine dioxygenase [Alphaproteobacteria bacterium]
MPERITVKPIAGFCGAEIDGVDLSQPLDDETFEAVQQAFLDHLVIFFRDQNLTPDQQIAFGRRFGELRISDQYQPLDAHPEILEIGKEPDATDIVGNLWHCDESFLERPALGSILYIIECPEFGGDTMFANQYAAYNALSPGMQDMLSSMRAVYSDGTLQQRNKGRSMKVHPDAANRPSYDAVHPVVRIHAQTGRKSLFVHRPYTVRFDGMTADESRPLLEFLYAHASRPEFTCRFRWEKGSVAFWDNRCAQHYALNDYSGVRRYGHRITVIGDVPH